MNSLSVTIIPKMVAFLLLIYLARAAAGSCLSYGHSCWGGHGKRSASIRHLLVPTSSEKHTDDWFLTKLAKLFRAKPVELGAYRPRVHDSGLLDVLGAAGHRRFPVYDLSQDTLISRDEVDSDNDVKELREVSNDVDGEALIAPEEDDLTWNAKIYQKMGDDGRRVRSG